MMQRISRVRGHKQRDARNRRGMRLLAALALTLGLCAAVPAFAQQTAPAEAQALKQACKADYKSLCASVQPGGGRILACLRQNRDKLSPTCQQALDNAKGAREKSTPPVQ